MVKNILWKFSFISLILTEQGHVKDLNYIEINGRNQTLILVISELDFETLAWISQRGSYIYIYIFQEWKLKIHKNVSTMKYDMELI